MATIHGTCPGSFEPVREALARNLDAGEDIGSSAAVVSDGELVVDIWGGFIDAERTRTWQRDTIVNMFSTTKTMTALCALVLADRGELDLDAPVAKYWPEFAAAGKERIEVRHLLSHSAGLAGWNETLVLEDLFDLDKITMLLARQAPWWTPGTASGYHPISFGPLIGEVIRRITGRSLGTFFADEIAKPLGADYHIGTGPECDARVARLIPSQSAEDVSFKLGDRLIQPGSMDSFLERAYFNPHVSPDEASTVPWRRAELGGSNGHGNARSVALVQSILANGGQARGVRLLSEAGCARALEVQTDGTDLMFGIPVRWGLGYALDSDFTEMAYGAQLRGHRVAYWGGSGGSFVINDLDLRMTIAFVMNKHVEAGGWDRRSVDIIKAAYDSQAVAR